MRTFSASLVLAALVASPAIAAPLMGRNVNVHKDDPHAILPRQGGPVQGLQFSQPLQSAVGASTQAPSIGLPLNFRPLGPAVPVSRPVSRLEPVQPVSFIPVGAALDGTNSAPPADMAPADTAAETAAASAPASSSTGTPVGTRPVSFIPVGAALGNNAKREPVQSPPIVPPGTFGGVAPASPSATEAAPATSQSATTSFRPVSFIPVGAALGNIAKREPVQSPPIVPPGTFGGVAPASPSATEAAPATSQSATTGFRPVSFIPVSALTGAQRKARSAIPPAGSAPGTVPASIAYPAGQSGGPMMYIFREDGSVSAMPAASGTV